MGTSNNEREQSTDTLIAVLSEKLEQMWQKLVNIENNTNAQRNDIRDIQLKVRDLENENIQQQKEIDERKDEAKKLRDRFTGLLFSIVGSILAGVILWLIKGV